jgi:hypothetical protein
MIAPQRFRLQPASGPVEEFDGMYDRNGGTGGKLGDAADIAGCDQIGPNGSYVGQLAIPQRGSDPRLQNVVGPRRAAAEMPFRHV